MKNLAGKILGFASPDCNPSYFEHSWTSSASAIAFSRVASVGVFAASERRVFLFCVHGLCFSLRRGRSEQNAWREEVRARHFRLQKDYLRMSHRLRNFLRHR